MRLKKFVEQMDDDIQESFDNVHTDVERLGQYHNVLVTAHNKLNREFRALRDEIATNGCIRDIRQLQKLMEDVLVRQDRFMTELDNLSTNGVATAINKLNEEVFQDKKTDRVTYSTLLSAMGYDEDGESATLRGKVDAICEYLHLDITIKPEEVKPAKAVAKKVTTKKKGSRR